MSTLPSSFTHISKISNCPNVTLGNTLSKRLNEYVYEFFPLPENSFLISIQASAHGKLPQGAYINIPPAYR